MSFSLGDILGTQFRIDHGGKRDRVKVVVGKGEYFFTPTQAREFAVALEYFAMCSEWDD